MNTQQEKMAIDAVIESKLDNARRVVSVISISRFYAEHGHPDYNSNPPADEDRSILNALEGIHFPAKVMKFKVTHIRANFDQWIVPAWQKS